MTVFRQGLRSPKRRHTNVRLRQMHGTTVFRDYPHHSIPAIGYLCCWNVLLTIFSWGKTEVPRENN